ncbi:hypothetical protein [Bacillus sp. PS06]|uniref:hypothetical protein n=1 Tax=Bacillus sp. PS06 TaxID=2764176 RepID=UPI001780AE51|nr:hypothetical protein [Bacillus sp. PS06]MBD8071550.1 hypothetical protein [Bacillus sp. PS06]
MIRVRMFIDFYKIEGAFPRDFVNYLKCEFTMLYDYLGNGERFENFQLSESQAIIILEELKERNDILKHQWDVEYLEEISVKDVTVERIGINLEFDIQLYYYVKRC